MKRIVSMLLAIVMVFSNSIVLFNALAEDDVLAIYSGSTQADYGFTPNCTFRINKVVGNEFRGSFAAENLSVYSFDESVSGKIYYAEDSFTCCFTVFFNNDRYYSDMCITIYPLNGIADCECNGSYHMESFKMTGTVFDFSDHLGKITDLYNLYNEENMKTCMSLSYAAYFDFEESNALIRNAMLEDEKYVTVLTDEYINICINRGLETDNIFTMNYSDTNPNNVAFSITYRKPKDNSNIVDMFVVLRGTLDDEWQGNAQITGSSYNNSIMHKNFELAKDSIKDYVFRYYNTLKETYSDVNLIITGHSRGAAVANLYAKEATDKLDNNTIPDFNKVTAYTFATPNVAKYNNEMESYTNIFNFCFIEDVVPTVPLTNPTSGWNYWKYGVTYCSNLSKMALPHKIVSENAIKRIHSGFWYWPNVRDYYEKELNGVFDSSTTLYNTIYDVLGGVKSKDGYSRYMAKQNIFNRIGTYPQLAPLICGAIFSNVFAIGNAHSQETYNNIISISGSATFNRYTYLNCTTDEYFSISQRLIGNEAKLGTFSSGYNAIEVSLLTCFYNQNNNSNKLDWDIEDASTWNGVIWDSSGNVTEIDLAYLDLDGSLDLSNFSSLQRVDISGNNITNIDVSGCSSLTSLNVSANKIELLDISDCTSLTEFDCSFNDLSTNGIDVSSNTDLTSFICDGCSLNSIDISSLVYLQEFSCSFNSLTTLSLDNNNALSSIICCYNYLDTHEGSALYNTLDDLMFDDVYVNYYPQSVPDNATFNTAELNALKIFANIDSNNSVLDWLDEDGNIDTNKLQNNVLFEYDGNNYRIAAIDISELEITGSLDLTAFAQLKELYCSQTGITSVNVNNCTKLEIIDCSDSQLSMLTLPSNSSDKNTPLYKVMCENNHLDINIFTDDIIKYVTFKAGSQLDYKHQIINASADEFDENDYNALCAFANQKDNLSSLDWDLTAPGEWDYVNWKLDTVSGKYKLLDCYFDCLDITGDIDLSGCTALEYASFSGSDIETAKLPVLTEKRYAAGTVETASLGANENAFYDCPKLEAVVISPLAEKIESGAFYNCKALQAVYVPESVISIADNSFGNCPNLTLAGADETTVSEYAFENSISFEEGYFLCARVNCQENTSGTFSAYYPIEDAQIINGDTVCAQTDEYGFFTVFGLEDGQYSYTVSYKFGFNVPLIASISGGCKTVTPPIAMPALNFNRDGYITVRDYTMLVRITQDSEDFKYYDINRDSVIDDVEKNLFTGLWNMAASDVISYNV